MYNHFQYYSTLPIHPWYHGPPFCTEMRQIPPPTLIGNVFIFTMMEHLHKIMMPDQKQKLSKQPKPCCRLSIVTKHFSNEVNMGPMIQIKALASGPSEQCKARQLHPSIWLTTASPMQLTNRNITTDIIIRHSSCNATMTTPTHQHSNT